MLVRAYVGLLRASMHWCTTCQLRALTLNLRQCEVKCQSQLDIPPASFGPVNTSVEPTVLSLVGGTALLGLACRVLRGLACRAISKDVNSDVVVAGRKSGLLH